MEWVLVAVGTFIVTVLGAILIYGRKLEKAGEEKGNNGWSMTIYGKPFVRWIWLGAIFMAFGGTMAAMDKRYRRLRQRQRELNKPVSGAGDPAPAAVSS